MTYRVEWTCHREAATAEDADLIRRRLIGEADGLPLRPELWPTVRVIAPDGLPVRAEALHLPSLFQETP